jgi:gluconolactonase
MASIVPPRAGSSRLLRLTRFAILSFVLSGSLALTAEQKAGVVAPDASLVLLSDGFSFTEGPAADAQGNIYFTDQPNNKIYRWSVHGKLSVFHDNPGRANGLYFDKSGNLFACADLNNELWMIDPTGEVTVLVKDFEGKNLNGPNDLWIDPKGGIYFTDPFYKRNYWSRGPMEQDGQHVYYLTPNRRKVLRVVNDLEQPNGLMGTPDSASTLQISRRGRHTFTVWVRTAP